jgi:murein DD-endopeptidase MepM/ murein hydrolase activator NlpD
VINSYLSPAKKESPLSIISDFLSSLKADPVLEPAIAFASYTPLDLSADNPRLEGIDLGDPEACQAYIDSVLGQTGGRVAYGGYLERRNLYRGNTGFEGNGEPRDVHLGVDFWMEAGTRVFAPISGTVHSFKNNAAKGDYGPTILLEHSVENKRFYTLYGHLSVESLSGLYPGKPIGAGEVLATLGTSEVNVHYAPHLHFQIILDLEGKQGDYPGVCRASEVAFYQANCPDPMTLLSYL